MKNATLEQTFSKLLNCPIKIFNLQRNKKVHNWNWNQRIFGILLVKLQLQIIAY